MIKLINNHLGEPVPGFFAVSSLLNARSSIEGQSDRLVMEMADRIRAGMRDAAGEDSVADWIREKS